MTNKKAYKLLFYKIKDIFVGQSHVYSTRYFKTAWNCHHFYTHDIILWISAIVHKDKNSKLGMIEIFFLL